MFSSIISRAALGKSLTSHRNYEVLFPRTSNAVDILGSPSKYSESFYPYHLGSLKLSSASACGFKASHSAGVSPSWPLPEDHLWPRHISSKTTEENRVKKKRSAGNLRECH